jgi:hypothetical protein
MLGIGGPARRKGCQRRSSKQILAASKRSEGSALVESATCGDQHGVLRPGMAVVAVERGEDPLLVREGAIDFRGRGDQADFLQRAS